MGMTSTSSWRNAILICQNKRKIFFFVGNIFHLKFICLRRMHEVQWLLLYSSTFSQLNADCHWLILGHMAFTKIKCISIVINLSNREEKCDVLLPW